MSSSTHTDLEQLRVAQGELCIGNTDGAVFVQLSPGAAMFLTDRAVALDQVSMKIRNTIDADHRNDDTKPKT